MKKYLFIDGGFMEAMIPKTEDFFGMQLPRPAQFDYRAIAGEFARTFYYDALPSRKDGETEEAFNLKFTAKIKLFERINRTPFRDYAKPISQKGVATERRGHFVGHRRV